MIKTLSKAQKMEREKFRIPRSVQDAIPIRRIFADGIFQVGNQYSKTWSFTDINYAIASKEDKTSMFLDYSELLNALDSGASAKITIYNRRINKTEFERSVLLPDKDDGLDEYRHEFNQMLTAQVTGTSNSILRERYLTVSVVKRNADEARSYFARVGTDLVTHLAQLSSVAQELTLTERLHIFRDFFKAGEQAAAEFNIHEHAKRGQHFKDWFCPDSMEFSADHFKLDARYGRVLYLQDYSNGEYEIAGDGTEKSDKAHYLAKQIYELAELDTDKDSWKGAWKVYIMKNQNDVDTGSSTAKITKFYYYNGTYSIEYNSEEATVVVEGDVVTLPSGWSDAIRGEREPSADENGAPLLSSSDFTPDNSHEGPLY